MSEKQGKPGIIGRKVRLFLLIFAVLLVPMVMDQAGVDRETVRMAGRIAAGATVLLTLYGLFAKVMRTFVFVILGLVILVVLVSEGTIKAPRVHEWFAARGTERK
jgi:uncharacterized membrane protein